MEGHHALQKESVRLRETTGTRYRRGVETSHTTLVSLSARRLGLTYRGGGGGRYANHCIHMYIGIHIHVYISIY